MRVLKRRDWRRGSTIDAYCWTTCSRALHRCRHILQRDRGNHGRAKDLAASLSYTR